MATLCVFCGGSTTVAAPHVDAAVVFARELTARGLGLVTGGGRIGLMGVVADTALAQGGRVTGVIPRFLVDRELAHDGLTALHVVDSLHERKTLMHQLSDGFVALPGGFGTLDELAEAITWRQLGLHDKPIGLLDVGGYWDGFVAQIERGVVDGLLTREHADLLVVEREPAVLVDRLRVSPATG
jgi:uncharacterized protein (TIGR00730 family)